MKITQYPRKAWRWLTSMRTALTLLFLLALAAVPGALLPQRSLNAGNVEQYLQANGKTAEIYDKLQLFDVFDSTWFAAIYVLLMISLVGCIVPRSWDHYKAMRSAPVRAPKRLDRMPHYRTGVIELPLQEAQDKAAQQLRKWKQASFSPEEDRAGYASLSAEKGYTREFCNLIFHLAIIVLLVFVASGKLINYEGNVIVVTESGSNDGTQNLAAPPETPALSQSTEFCNTSVSNFDSFRAGALVDGTKLTPFCFIAHNFSAKYLPSGQAEMFRSDISYAVGKDIFSDPSTWDRYSLEVNHPLRIAGDRIYLQGHGFAPTFTVTWPNGEKRTQTVQFRPDDPTYFLSSGAMRFDPPAGMYPDLYERRQHQLALQGLFAPTASWSGEKGELLSSAFPAMRDPAVAIDIYRGDNGLDTGVGQSLFSLDSSLISSGQLLKIDRVNLVQGQSVTLDDGTTITFDGASEYANYQISHDPFQKWVLFSALLLLISLMSSLAIKRRRVWVRFKPLSDTSTEVTMAGLSRTDKAGWGEEFLEIADDLLGPAESETQMADENGIENDRVS
ncbi:cytochrome c biogenesis protein ResB [Corynebacterium caspium]|uniref:cytochrome c biogenesis protein ResB n=1 Tax=Corynebacterium caspium TaxID=234828 RepID=UPI000366936B|nr:cytochrome c biogenesis protein ResB [Corynebacterium caspium]WKD59893.1 Cytochrome c biogenesis protein Ccs1 [Corynebacterium caspium DSM 44850]